MDPNGLFPQVELRPDKCGGRPCIAGTRIHVQDVYVWHELCGLSPDAIVDEFPDLSPSQVHMALAYFWDHQQEIRRQMSEDDEFVARYRADRGLGRLDRLDVSARPR
jgi:uncharacterized protein (DUF433 family)